LFVSVRDPNATNAPFPATDDRPRSTVLLVCFFARTDEEEDAGETTLVKIGEAIAGRGLKKKQPMTTLATAPRKASGMAVGNDKRNGWGRRAAGR
jgi:hypothetical protein